MEVKGKIRVAKGSSPQHGLIGEVIGRHPKSKEVILVKIKDGYFLYTKEEIEEITDAPALQVS